MLILNIDNHKILMIPAKDAHSQTIAKKNILLKIRRPWMKGPRKSGINQFIRKLDKGINHFIRVLDNTYDNMSFTRRFVWRYSARTDYLNLRKQIPLKTKSKFQSYADFLSNLLLLLHWYITVIEFKIHVYKYIFIFIHKNIILNI